jgi:hypothetical protein
MVPYLAYTNLEDYSATLVKEKAPGSRSRGHVVVLAYSLAQVSSFTVQFRRMARADAASTVSGASAARRRPGPQLCNRRPDRVLGHRLALGLATTRPPSAEVHHRLSPAQTGHMRGTLRWRLSWRSRTRPPGQVRTTE